MLNSTSIVIWLSHNFDYDACILWSLCFMMVSIPMVSDHSSPRNHQDRHHVDHHWRSMTVITLVCLSTSPSPNYWSGTGQFQKVVTTLLLTTLSVHSTVNEDLTTDYPIPSLFVSSGSHHCNSVGPAPRNQVGEQVVPVCPTIIGYQALVVDFNGYIYSYNGYCFMVIYHDG